MTKILVAGVDRTNHNYRKIEEFFNAFSRKYETKHTLGDIASVAKNLANGPYDIAFGEFENFQKLDMSMIKNFVFWANIPISDFLLFAKKNPNTNFVLAPKSTMHIDEVTNRYTKMFGNNYQICGEEGQNLKDLQDTVNGNQKITDYLYKLAENASYMFLPCSLSQKESPLPAEYDICYFGTKYNRPKVAFVLQKLFEKGYRIKSTFESGFIDPQECIQLYRKSICTITQQIHPVMLEHPVRLGESTSCGCLTFVIDSFIDENSNDLLVPQFKHALNVEQIEDYIQTHSSVSERQKIVDSFTSTYDTAVERIFESLAIY